MADITGQITFTPEEIATFPQGPEGPRGPEGPEGPRGPEGPTGPPGGGSGSGYLANVKDFGAKGDGVTDDSPAIQAAVNSLPTTGNIRGGALYFPRGQYKCVSTINLDSKPPIRFVGEQGMAYSSAHDVGSTLRTGTAGMELVRWAKTSIQHEGMTFEHMAFRDVAGGSTLLSIKNLNRGTVRDCFFRDAACGIRLNAMGTTGDASWWMFDNVHMRNCQVGYDFLGYCNNQIQGGELNGTSGNTMLVGIRTDHFTNQLKVYGTKFNNCGTGVVVLGFGNFLSGLTFERCGISVLMDGNPAIHQDSSEGTIMLGGFIFGSGSETGVKITANARQIHAGPVHFSWLAKKFDVDPNAHGIYYQEAGAMPVFKA